MGLRQKLKNSQNYRWLVLGIVSVGTFMATLDASIVNVALPFIAADFQAGVGRMQWVVTSYLLTISSLLPAFGRLADMVGRRRIYSLGFVVFVMGSALCGLSFNLASLVAFRVVQALGAAMIMANALAIVTAAFPAHERGRALGLIGSVVAAGSLTGPSLGGAVVNSVGWPYIFYLNLPVGIAGSTLAYLLLPEQVAMREGKRPGFDFTGAALFVGGVVSLLLALSSGRELGAGTLLISFLWALAVVCLVWFTVVESRLAEPMIDLALFRQRMFAMGNLSGFISYVVMFLSNYLMPFYLKRVLGYGPSRVGLLMTPIPVAMAVVAPFSGWLSDRIGSVVLTSAGMAVLAMATSFLSTLGGDSSYLDVAWRLLLLGIGMGLFTSPNNSAVMGVVPRPQLGVAGGVVATVRNLGMMLGVALAANLFSSRAGALTRGDFTGGEEAAFLAGMAFVFRVGTGLSVAGMLISLMRSGSVVLKSGEQAGRAPSSPARGSGRPAE